MTDEEILKKAEEIKHKRAQEEAESWRRLDDGMDAMYGGYEGD